MPDSTVKLKNVSGEDRIVPSLGRLVMAGQEVEIPKADAAGFDGQPEIWQLPKATAKRGRNTTSNDDAGDGTED